MRYCPKCKIDTDRYGNGACKPCARKGAMVWKAANLERANATTAAWVAANSERMREKKADWNKSNPERKKASDAAWRSANRDKTRASSMAWGRRNPAKIKENSAAYHAANPEASRIQSQNRRAKKRLNGGVLSKGIIERLFSLQRGKCPCCQQPLGDNYHLDHIMPVALGGTNEDWNMQLLRKTCNLQKNAKHPIDFMQARGFLI